MDRAPGYRTRRRDPPDAQDPQVPRHGPFEPGPRLFADRPRHCADRRRNPGKAWPDRTQGERNLAGSARNPMQVVEGGTSETTVAYNLRLYVAGQTAKSITAFANLKKICEQYILGKYKIEVVDLLKNPTLAKGDQILAVPTLVRKLPVPIRKIPGGLSNTERVLIGLDLRPRIDQTA